MDTLGINAAFHDSAAALIRDGKVVAAAEDERFTHVKHGKRPVPFSTYELPYHAIDFCLKEAGITLRDVDHIAYSYNPFVKLGRLSREKTITLPLEPSAHPTPEEWESAWDPLFLSSIVNAPRQLKDGVPHHLKARFRGVSADGPYKWHYVDHHVAHAASTFFVSPFEEAAIMTLDGRGERTTTSYGMGRGHRLEHIGEVSMPHSLGMLYEEVTRHLGFLHSSDEYKVMALASYGKPEYADVFRSMIRMKADGRYEIDWIPFEKTLGPARFKGEPFEEKHFNIAHSLQAVLEETVFNLADWLHERTGSSNLCMAGGVALNCVMNGRLRDRGPFRDIWVQPAAGDAGTALGAALWVDAMARHANGGTNGRYVMEHAFLGPQYSEEEIEEFLKWSKLPYRRLENVVEETAEILARDKVIGWFQGRMEFGPRALGSRSILASPLKADMQERLNEIKDREDFRPVAPVVLEEEAQNWFRGARVSPFMLFVFDVIPEQKSKIPAVTHVDGTARVQTINARQNAPYYELIRAFFRRTGVPVLINTSFNTRGEPIVCTPRDAVESFWTSPLDALVIGPFLLEKNGGAR